MKVVWYNNTRLIAWRDFNDNVWGFKNIFNVNKVQMWSKGEKKESPLWPGASKWRIYYHTMWGQLSTTCSNVLMQPTVELLVAVNHNQLRTMASEMLDPIDWSNPPPSWAVPIDRLVHSINQCNLSGNWTCNRSMRGNHLAYAATQGIIISYQGKSRCQ